MLAVKSTVGIVFMLLHDITCILGHNDGQDDMHLDQDEGHDDDDAEGERGHVGLPDDIYKVHDAVALVALVIERL